MGCRGGAGQADAASRVRPSTPLKTINMTPPCRWLFVWHLSFCSRLTHCLPPHSDLLASHLFGGRKNPVLRQSFPDVACGAAQNNPFPLCRAKAPLFFWGAFSFARASFPLFPLSGTQIRQLRKSASCHCPQIQACHAAVRAESCAVGFKKLFAARRCDDRSMRTPLTMARS